MQSSTQKVTCSAADIAPTLAWEGSSCKAAWAGTVRTGAGRANRSLPWTLLLRQAKAFELMRRTTPTCFGLQEVLVLVCIVELLYGFGFSMLIILAGFSAIVTRFHLRVRQSSSVMMASTFIYPIARYREVMDWVTKLSPEYGHDTEIVAVSACPPGLGQRCIIAHFVAFQHDSQDGIKALQLANETRPGDFLVEVINDPTSLAKEYADQADANPEGHQYCAGNAYINNDADVVDVLEESFMTLPHPKALALWFAMAPCSRRKMPDMAMDMQTDHYFALYTFWEHETDDKRCMEWVHSVGSRVAPHAAGAYLGDSDFQMRKPDFWSKDHAKRLAEVCNRWNPKGQICGYLGMDDILSNDTTEKSPASASVAPTPAANGDVTVVANGHHKPRTSDSQADFSAKDANSQAHATKTLNGKVAVISGSSSGIGKASQLSFPRAVLQSSSTTLTRL